MSCTPGRAVQNVTSAVVLEDAFEFIVPKTEVASLALYRVLEEEGREYGTCKIFFIALAHVKTLLLETLMGKGLNWTGMWEI